LTDHALMSRDAMMAIFRARIASGEIIVGWRELPYWARVTNESIEIVINRTSKAVV